ncbi:MAG: UbiD family decarboxylase [Myxococcales bacterium]|nr:UbiD family decarboxylase [Myxococcales bacterium]
MRVESGPVHDVVLGEEDLDLERLPLLKHSEKDSGWYLTGGVQVARDPGGSVQQVGIHRMMRFGRRELGFWGGKDRRIRAAIEKHDELGLDTPMAVVIGAPPALVMAACACLPHTRDKHGIAGALQGSPLELVKCKTVDLMVPANAEIVIEGYARAGERRPEGPFGEFTGCYGRETVSPVFHATAITMRRGAIFQDFLTGFPISEDQALMYLPRCAAVYQSAAAVHPAVKAVHWQVDGGNIYGVVVSIRKRLQAEPWNVIASVLAGPALVKQCIVVDEDIDVFDAEAVHWALSTRVQPHRDVHIFPTMVGAPLDPSSPDIWESSKIGYDATIPLGDDRARYERSGCRARTASPGSGGRDERKNGALMTPQRASSHFLPDCRLVAAMRHRGAGFGLLAVRIRSA